MLNRRNLIRGLSIFSGTIYATSLIGARNVGAVKLVDEVRKSLIDFFEYLPNYNALSEEEKYFAKATYIYGAFGIIFFVFNCVLLTSFCGIYPNSVSKLAINTIVSIIGSSVIIIIFYLIGVIIRYFSLKNEDEMLYIISRIFNPLNLSCNDIKKMTCKRGNKKRGQNLFDNPGNQ